MILSSYMICHGRKVTVTMSPKRTLSKYLHRHAQAKSKATSTMLTSKQYYSSSSSSSVLSSPIYRSCVNKVKRIIENTELATKQGGLSSADVALLKNASERLDQVFLFVVVGEYNSGKSSFINSLLGEEVCTTGVLPTTDSINVLHYGTVVSSSRDSSSEKIQNIYLPINILKEANIVDTPGTNAILRDHQYLTEHFVPRSDLVLFVTSVDRPFSESERSFLQLLSGWHKKVVFIINKWDLVASSRDRTLIRDYVTENAAKVLGSSQVVVKTISARNALLAKLQLKQKMGGTGANFNIDTEAVTQALKTLEESGMQELEAFIKHTLADQTQCEIKLLNPIGICSHLLSSSSNILSRRFSLLDSDVSLLSSLSDEIVSFEADLARDLTGSVAKLDAILADMTARADKFIDDTFTIRNARYLINKENIARDFDKAVHQNVAEDIQTVVSTLIDWTVGRTNRTLAHLSQTLIKRNIDSQEHHQREVLRLSSSSSSSSSSLSSPSSSSSSLISLPSSALSLSSSLSSSSSFSLSSSSMTDFMNSRQSLLIDLSNKIRDIVSNKNKRVDSSVVLDHRRTLLIESSLLSLSSLSFACVSLLTGTSASALSSFGVLSSLSSLGVAGVSLASGLAGGAGVLGLAALYAVPHRRRLLKTLVRRSIVDARDELVNVVVRHVAKENEEAARTMKAMLTPYQRFTTHELDIVKQTAAKIESTQAEIIEATEEIRKAFPDAGVTGSASNLKRIQEDNQKDLNMLNS